MKLSKTNIDDISRLLKNEEFQDYIVTTLADKPEKILSAVRQHIRNPRPIKFDKIYGSTNNTKTPLGFLYSSFNNMKSKYGLSDYSKRNDFIARFLYSKKFAKIFYAYEESDFNFFMKPRFEHGDNIEDIKLIKKGYKIQKIRRDDIVTHEVTYWKSLNLASDDIDTSTSNVSKALRDGSLIQSRYKFKYTRNK